MINVTHRFVSPKSEQTDPTIVGPNEWNAVHVASDTSGNFYAIDYAFSGITATGSPNLTGGIANTVTLPAGILGLNGTDGGHNIRISGGTGTAETVLVAGGTYTPTLGGTLTFTPANNHTGAWTLSTATGGIAEAQQAIGVGNWGQIFIQSSLVNMYATVNGLSSGKITFRGISPEATVLLRQFIVGNMFNSTSSNTQWTFYNIGINQETGSIGYAIAITAATSVHIYNVAIFNGSGVSLVGTTYADIEGVNHTYTDNTVDAIAGLSVTGQCVNTVVRNSFFGSSGAYNGTHGLLNGVLINGADGFWATNVGAGGADQGWNISSPTSGGFTTNIQCVGCFCDTPYGYALHINPGTMPMALIRFVGGHFHGQYPFGGNLITILVDSGSSAIKDLQLLGLVIEGSSVGGLEIDNVGASGIVVFGNIIASNNRAAGGSAQVNIATGVTGLTFTNNIVHSDSSGTGAFGFFQTGTLSGIVKDNDFTDNTTPYHQGGAFTGLFGPNKGVDDVVATVASAATLALPVGSAFNLTGGVGVTTITTRNPINFVWEFTVGASTTFTTGTGIGNTITITKFGTIRWDGTHAWINGV